MNPGRFFMPNPMTMRNAYVIPREASIFSKLFNNIRSINFGKLLNGANKTLNIMNQTIPLIRQATPIVSNAKSMLHLMKTFKKETNSNIKRNNNTINKNSFSNYNKKKNDDFPTFFI